MTSCKGKERDNTRKWNLYRAEPSMDASKFRKIFLLVTNFMIPFALCTKKKPHSPLLLSQEDIISGASIRYICYSLPWCNSNGMLWKWRRSQNTDKNNFTLYTERHSEFPISIAGKYHIQHAQVLLLFISLTQLKRDYTHVTVTHRRDYFVGHVQLCRRLLMGFFRSREGNNYWKV